MITNADRAAWADHAVQAFRDICPTDREDAPGDLVVNILHLMRREHPEVDLAWWLQRKLDTHDIEVAEDPEE